MKIDQIATGATFLLAQEEIDTPNVRDALTCAAKDDDDMVRAEAVFGLAIRDPPLALPFVQQALQADAVATPTARSSRPLRASVSHSGFAHLGQTLRPPLAKLAADALAACEKAR